MNHEELESRYLRWLDESDGTSMPDEIRLELAKHPELATVLERWRSTRVNLLRTQPATFGPYFVQKVLQRISAAAEQTDQFILFFFRRYQLAIIGVVIALLTINVVFSEQLNVDSFFNIQQNVSTDDSEIAAFDFTSYFDEQ